MRQSVHHIIRLAMLIAFSPAAFADSASTPSGAAEGESAQAAPANSNEAVSEAWAKSSPNVDSPSLSTQADGSTKIEWHGGVSVDHYENVVHSQNNFGSSLRPGGHSLLQLQSDLRATNQAGDVNYFQLGATVTDDRNVLSEFSRQINTVQVGRAGAGYIASFGDVAPNFSSLSSSLGVRGFLGQKQLGQTTLTGYAGLVAPSWEYIESRVPRTMMMKEVQGAKIEYAFNERFKAYVTGQHGKDRADSPDTAGFIATENHTGSIGAQYSTDSFQLAAETAISHFSQEGDSSRNGHASIVDGSWRANNLTLRAGYHDVNVKYASLSQAAQPGVREAYTGADWVLASWISLGADLRNSKQFTLATLLSPSQMTDTDSGSIRANINFGENYPNWTMGLQESISNSRDPLKQRSYKEQSTINLNYAQAQWNAALAYGLSRDETDASPTANGHTDSWQASLGRQFNNQDALTNATWSINTGISANLQDQHLSSGLDTKAFTTSFTVAAQRNGWGLLNIALGNGFNTRPSQSALRMTSVQIDASRPIGERGSIKLYARDIHRNLNDVSLYANERTAGVQLGYVF